MKNIKRFGRKNCLESSGSQHWLHIRISWGVVIVFVRFVCLFLILIQF